MSARDPLERLVDLHKALKGAVGKARDPRLDPQKGDVLYVDGGNRLEVFERKANRVLYKLTSLHPIYPTDSIPMQCGAYLGAWRKICKTATVIHTQGASNG